jgi:N-acetylmuramoyl-L-alanine amidase
MARTNKLKTRLLRDAVEDNVATMNGSLPKPLRRSRRFVARWGSPLTGAFLLIVFVAVLRLVPASGTTVFTPPPTISHNSPAIPQPVSAAPTFSRPQHLSVAALALGVRRIVIDAGHGGTSLGTSAASGLHEKDVTLDIAERLRQRLASQGVGVLMTRKGDDTLSLEERSNLANSGRGDLFLSIHVNSLPPRTRGVETYFLGPSEAPSVDAVAAAENRDSGYSMTDLRALVDMIYADARRDESRRFATSVHSALLRDLRRVNPGIEDRGVKTAPFVVLAATRMPAILAEVSCLSNDDEAELLGDVSYRQSIADALFTGIEAYLHQGVRKEHKETGNGS